MSINVYWSCLEEEWLRAKKPESVYKIFTSLNKTDIKEKMTHVNFCPAFKNELQKTYSIKSLYDYEFFFNKEKSYSTMFSQNFFDEHVITRSLNLKMFSFKNTFIFFTDQKSLKVSQHGPFMEENDISKKCIVTPGEFDIGKWYRSLDFAFYVKENFNSIELKEKDSLYYLRFHTDKKINFIQYKNNDVLRSYLHDVLASKNHSKYQNLNNYYNMFKNKNKILNEIKKNII
jgi:hypothetical protein